MKEEKVVLVCSECGNENVQSLMWVNINTKEAFEELDFTEKHNNWCSSCDKHVEVTSLEEFIKREKELDEDE